MARKPDRHNVRLRLWARVRRLRRAITLPGAEPHHEALLHEQVLGPRLLLFAKVRFLVAGVVAAGALAGRHVIGVEELPVAALVAIAGAIAFYNIPLFFLAPAGTTGRTTPASSASSSAV